MDCHGDEDTIHLFVTADHVMALSFSSGNILSSPVQLISKGFNLAYALLF